MYDVEVIAKYILTFSDEEVGDLISNLKLQKLLYYSQGFSLAINNKPLFVNDIVAWEHGPVVKEIYHKYKEYGPSGIPVEKGFDFSTISEETRELVEEVYEVYGQFSAWKLRNMTHEELPWLKTDKNEVISKDLMRAFFITLVN